MIPVFVLAQGSPFQGDSILHPFRGPPYVLRLSHASQALPSGVAGVFLGVAELKVFWQAVTLVQILRTSSRSSASLALDSHRPSQHRPGFHMRPPAAASGLARHMGRMLGFDRSIGLRPG